MIGGLEKGSIVDVQLHSGERLLGEVKAVRDTVIGRKVQVAFGDRTALVDMEQIVGVVKGTEAPQLHGGYTERHGVPKLVKS